MRRSTRRSARQFFVRLDRGSIAAEVERFSTGFVGESKGELVEVSDDAVIAAAMRILSERIVKSKALTSPKLTREYLAMRFAGLEHEVFTCLFLDNRHRVIACEELFRGTIDGASVHPREVVKRALAHNAAAVILAHNHPSGVTEPSRPDELITRRLKEALYRRAWREPVKMPVDPRRPLGTDRGALDRPVAKMAQQGCWYGVSMPSRT